MGITIINFGNSGPEDDERLCERIRDSIRQRSLLVYPHQKSQIAEACRVIAEFNELPGESWESIDAFPIDPKDMRVQSMCMAINLAATIATAINANVTELAEQVTRTAARGLPYLIALIRATTGDSAAVWDIIRRYCADTDKQFRVQLLMVVEACCSSVDMDAKWLRQLADELDATPPSSGSDADRPAADPDSPDRQG